MYGSRGVGKTLFSIQFAANMLAKKYTVHLLISNQSRNLKLLCQFYPRIPYKRNLYLYLIDTPRDIIISFTKILKRRRPKSSVIILDETLPMQFFVRRAWSESLTKKLGLIFSLFGKLLEDGNKLLITLPEQDNIPLPRRWPAFIEFSKYFYRLRRKGRLRELFSVKLLNLPSEGQLWNIDPKSIRLETILLARLYPTRFGFSLIEKEEF